MSSRPRGITGDLSQSPDDVCWGRARHLEWCDPMTQSTQDLIAEYRSTAIAWDIMQSDAKKANPLFNRLHAIFKELRLEQAGRAVIKAVMHDATVNVGAR